MIVYKDLMLRKILNFDRGAFFFTASSFHVADPARVTFTPSVQYIPKELKGIIRCETDANPPITYITWKKDSRLFDPFNTAGIMALLNGSLLIDMVCCVYPRYSIINSLCVHFLLSCPCRSLSSMRVNTNVSLSTCKEVRVLPQSFRSS